MSQVIYFFDPFLSMNTSVPTEAQSFSRIKFRNLWSLSVNCVSFAFRGVRQITKILSCMLSKRWSLGGQKKIGKQCPCSVELCNLQTQHVWLEERHCSISKAVCMSLQGNYLLLSGFGSQKGQCSGILLMMLCSKMCIELCCFIKYKTLSVANGVCFLCQRCM